VEDFLFKMLPSLPSVVVLAFFLGMNYMKFKSFCRALKVMEDRLYHHIANHPHCGPDDDLDDEEETPEDEGDEP